jgi:hypothetical protein
MPQQLPNVSISHLDGQLGRIAPSADGTAGLILSGTATLELPLNTPVLMTSVEDLESKLINNSTNPLAYREISSFFAVAGSGAKLWVMLIADTVELADLVSAGHVANILDIAEGEIRLLGVNRRIPTGYDGDVAENMFEDVANAMAAIHTLALQYRDAHKPFRCLLPLLGADHTLFGSQKDLRAGTFDTIAVIAWCPDARIINRYVPGVGYTLGKLASIPVNQNIGRVKSGPEAIVVPYVFDENPQKGLQAESKWEGLHAKGYIFMRKHFGLPGWYFNDDPAATKIESDYSGLSRGRTIDKAHRIAYISMAEELLDDIDIDSAGKIPPAMTGYYQAKVEAAIRTQMNTEVSDVIAFVDPNQDVLATDKLQMRLRVRPRGQVKYIDIDLSFDNPNNN